MIDLAIDDMGNVLLRALHWSGSDVADQLDDLIVVCGAPLAMAAAWFREAAVIGAAHALCFHDACWVAAAQASPERPPVGRRHAFSKRHDVRKRVWALVRVASDAGWTGERAPDGISR